MRCDNAGDALMLGYEVTDRWQSDLAAACAINLGFSISTLLRGDIPLHAAAAEVDGRVIGSWRPPAPERARSSGLCLTRAHGSSVTMSCLFTSSAAA